MASSYGFAQPKYGANVQQTMQPFSTSLARAAAPGTPTVGDPFGLLGKPGPGQASVDGSTTLAPKTTPTTTQTPPVVAPPVAPTTGTTPPGTGTGTAPSAPAYDINTDPALQMTNAFTGLSDQQAQAAADQQRRDALLAYGDQELVKQLVGDNTLAQAAANNPTSTLAQLSHQKDTSLRDLLTNLTTGGHNLGYSGYRVAQEGELGNQYENALANAAANEQSTLSGISNALNSAKQSNAQSRATALGDAYSRFIQQALTNPPTGDQTGTTAPTDPTDPLSGGRSILTAPDYLTALALAAGTHRPVAL